MIKSRVLKTGDGSHMYNKLNEKDAECPSDNNNNGFERDTEHFWGFGKIYLMFFVKFVKLFIFLNLTGDKEMTEEDMKNVLVLNREVD